MQNCAFIYSITIKRKEKKCISIHVDQQGVAGASEEDKYRDPV